MCRALKLDRRERLQAVAFQNADILAHHGLTKAEAERALHVIDAQGAIHKAGKAVGTVLAELPFLWPLAHLWKLPGFSAVADALYYFVAARRDRLGAYLSCTASELATCHPHGTTPT